MTMRCACLAAFVVLALTGSPARSAEKNTAEREAQDPAQIEKLMWQCVRGQSDAGTNAVKGREALKKMIIGLRHRAVANESKPVRRGPRLPRYREQLPRICSWGPRVWRLTG
jgi:hypothetical protein